MIIIHPLRYHIGNHGDEHPCEKDDARNVGDSTDDEHVFSHSDGFVGVEVVERIAVDEQEERQDPSVNAFVVALGFPVGTRKTQEQEREQEQAKHDAS